LKEFIIDGSIARFPDWMEVTERHATLAVFVFRRMRIRGVDSAWLWDIASDAANHYRGETKVAGYLFSLKELLHYGVEVHGVVMASHVVAPETNARKSKTWRVSMTTETLAHLSERIRAPELELQARMRAEVGALVLPDLPDDTSMAKRLETLEKSLKMEVGRRFDDLSAQIEALKNLIALS
jgi:hypothetical protein